MSEAPPRETGYDVRLAARSGYGGLTVGRAPGYVQANIFVIAERFASDFEAFCRANPAACPLIGRSDTGLFSMPALGRDIDIRTDLPSYLVHDRGRQRMAEDIVDAWREDCVVFAIGCWLGAEGALARAGIRMRHMELGLQGGLYRTRLPATAAGAFEGQLVVSMRPFRKADVELVRSITAGMPLSHGAPIHEGEPAVLGIDDPACADWGETLLPGEDETALFWPCGLTALAALQNAGVPFFISHAPGAMLVTDLREMFAS